MNVDRKAAIQAYKERKTPRGICAVRCSVTGNVWTDSAMDLEAMENRIWFAVRLEDRFMNKALIGEYREHGRDAFSYEVVEKLDDDIVQMSLRDVLKERKAHWIEKLNAQPIF
jgi:hypothetical protein